MAVADASPELTSEPLDKTALISSPTAGLIPATQVTGKSIWIPRRVLNVLFTSVPTERSRHVALPAASGAAVRCSGSPSPLSPARWLSFLKFKALTGRAPQMLSSIRGRSADSKLSTTTPRPYTALIRVGLGSGVRQHCVFVCVGPCLVCGCFCPIFWQETNWQRVLCLHTKGV